MTSPSQEATLDYILFLSDEAAVLRNAAVPAPGVGVEAHVTATCLLTYVWMAFSPAIFIFSSLSAQ